ncbi:LPXTG cell wall anchor domain-containing protein [Actinokineospora sp. G85]|uniref:LPXTG cell wall anchor domain-containing protein n=1 Tax=Actinokineospora sp. G85 TaxID=3406626 RepID=UPI003C77AD65
MSASRSRVLARAAVIGVLASAASIGLVGTASAHTGVITAKCTPEGSEVTVKLSAYNGQGNKNTWELTVDGEKVADGNFGGSLEKTWGEFDPTVAHKYEVKVVAWDGPDNKNWSPTLTEESEACVEPEETTPPEEEPTSTPEEEPTTSPEEPTTTPRAPESTPPVKPTTSAPVAAPAGEDDLADTGASIALPLAIGGVLVLGGAGALVAVRRKTAKG